MYGRNWYNTSDDCENWMEKSSIAIGTLPLNELIIPMTHDAASFSIKSIKPVLKSAKLHEWDFVQQLNNGVRALDIRLNYDTFYSNKIIMVHGIAKAESWQYGLNQICEWIFKHPKELVIFSMQYFGTSDKNADIYLVNNSIIMICQILNKHIIDHQYIHNQLTYNQAMRYGNVIIAVNKEFGHLMLEKQAHKCTTSIWFSPNMGSNDIWETLKNANHDALISPPDDFLRIYRMTTFLNKREFISMLVVQPNGSPKTNHEFGKLITNIFPWWLWSNRFKFFQNIWYINLISFDSSDHATLAIKCIILLNIAKGLYRSNLYNDDEFDMIYPKQFCIFHTSIMPILKQPFLNGSVAKIWYNIVDDHHTNSNIKPIHTRCPVVIYKNKKKYLKLYIENKNELHILKNYENKGKISIDNLLDNRSLILIRSWNTPLQAYVFINNPYVENIDEIVQLDKDMVLIY